MVRVRIEEGHCDRTFDKFLTGELG